jgi:N-ethylmaleimide reductase
MSQEMSPLFKTVRLGDLELPKLIVVAPLSRNRAEYGTEVPRKLNAICYAPRASSGFINTNATQISRRFNGNKRYILGCDCNGYNGGR